MLPIRLRDFLEDKDGRLYAVSAYDNEERAGCVLRYVPDDEGERCSKKTGQRYKKYDFEPAFEYIKKYKPEYLDVVHRVPLSDIKRVLKPDQEISDVMERDSRVKRLAEVFGVPKGTFGCTGSLLCGLENELSDIDMVVYGKYWFVAQQNLIEAVSKGVVSALSDDLWDKVYNKRVPEIDYDTFVMHEKRKWNRGEIDGTYFDLLYTRGYENLNSVEIKKGKVLGKKTIEAKVLDASLSFDSPAVYTVDHPEISKVLSFTHTYSGQALDGEIIEACGVVEDQGNEKWLIVGTTREAKGEYIISKTLLENSK
ncbi:DNA polymerase subunit beta [Methanoplanus sp. FWC-SCC4]|uniref:DNA polymerase subunit beta n=1 Tax=Methanochimaera problematica TaxID=2609417 RepID=A0AA97I3K2_9EURY|nr:DNA polymerase subunit beta [Methanoplanus sp. FWC-SCC4]WOF15644.1 DNA polymerase subunit beta [Methanoplanus sp. FWC-SCC4]